MGIDVARGQLFLSRTDIATTDDSNVNCHKMHASKQAGKQVQVACPLLEKVGEALPEFDTENVWGRWQDMLIVPAHSLSVNYLQLLLSERS